MRTVRQHEATLKCDGYRVVASLLSSQQVDRLVRGLPTESSRRLLDRAGVREIADALAVHPSLRDDLAGLVPVQAIWFVKSRERNWLVPPHRDEVLPITGQGPWPDAGLKEGLPSVRAGRGLLDRCVALRLSCDEVPEGDIAVVPGSHLDDRRRSRDEAVRVVVPPGGAVLLRPSTVHCSSKLTQSPRRRVLHLLYGPPELPFGYRWAVWRGSEPPSEAASLPSATERRQARRGF